MELLNEELPEYKLKNHGIKTLTDVDIIAALLGGDANKAMAKARLLIQKYGDLLNIGRCDENDLKALGFNKTECVRLLVGIEYGKRMHMPNLSLRPKISKSGDAYQCIYTLLNTLSHEEFWILLLNKANEVIGREKISTGGMSGTVVDSKMVFRVALAGKAAGIILVHNHPSGSVRPSEADIRITTQLKNAGVLLDMPIWDHLIIGDSGYYSFSDEGMI